MNFEKLKQLDYFIQSESTGTPSELAAKMKVSKSMVFRYISFMKKELNAPICYKQMKETYVYEEKGKVCLEGWVWERE